MTPEWMKLALSDKTSHCCKKWYTNAKKSLLTKEAAQNSALCTSMFVICKDNSIYEIKAILGYMLVKDFNFFQFRKNPSIYFEKMTF